MMKKTVFLFFGVILSAAGATEPTRSVSVSGACTRSVIPDRGAVVVTIEARDADAKRAQVAATRQYEAVRSRVVGLYLADGEISTSEYVSEEVREWEKDRQISKGFRTRIGLRTETSDYGRLGEVIEIASREKVNTIGGLYLFVSTKKAQEEKMLCLKEASEHAKAKAESLARALGAKVGEVLTISETTGPEYSPPTPIYGGAMAMDAVSAKAAPRIEPGKTEISTSVLVTFGLK
jgi:uncharacterized protein YggE